MYIAAHLVRRAGNEGINAFVYESLKRGAAEARSKREERSLAEVWAAWEEDGRAFWKQMDALVDSLEELARIK